MPVNQTYTSESIVNTNIFTLSVCCEIDLAITQDLFRFNKLRDYS